MTIFAPKEEKLVVVPYRPWRKLWILILILFGYLSIAAAAYYGGQFIADRHNPVPQEHQLPYIQETDSAENKIADLERELELQKNHLALEKQSVVFVQNENKKLQKMIAQLKEQVAYYQRVIEPGNQDKGLIISELELKPTIDKQRYRYAFKIVQISGTSRVGGTVTMVLSGMQNDGNKQKPVEYQFKDLNEQRSSKLKVGFRSFQEIKGDITLPKYFSPTELEIIASIRKGKRVTLRRVYQWPHREHQLNVE